MGHELEEPPWDPLHWDSTNYYYESLTDIEQRLGLPALSSSHISTIEAFTHDTDVANPTNPLYLVRLAIKFTENN